MLQSPSLDEAVVLSFGPALLKGVGLDGLSP
jgi:hypothetical protein